MYKTEGQLVRDMLAQYLCIESSCYLSYFSFTIVSHWTCCWTLTGCRLCYEHFNIFERFREKVSRCTYMIEFKNIWNRDVKWWDLSTNRRGRIISPKSQDYLKSYTTERRLYRTVDCVRVFSISEEDLYPIYARR